MPRVSRGKMGVIFMKKKTVRLLIWTFIILLAIAAASVFYALQKIDETRQINDLYVGLADVSGINPFVPTNMQADFKVYVDGTEVQFTDPLTFKKNAYVTLLPGDSNVNVIHVYAQGITIGDFFRTLGMTLSRTCINATGDQLCSEPEKGRTLKFYVNGQPTSDGPDYVIQDQDKILVSYGKETYHAIQVQLDTIGDLAASANAQVPSQ